MAPSRSTRWLVSRWRAGQGGWVRLKGWSMAPALRDGDWLRVAPGTAQPGEVVAYLLGSEIVAHRLVRFDQAGRAVTRGDARAVDDPPVEELLGRVVEVRRCSRLRRWLERRWSSIASGDRG